MVSTLRSLAAGIVEPLLILAQPLVLDSISQAVSALVLWRLRTDFSPLPNPALLDLKREVLIAV